MSKQNDSYPESLELYPSHGLITAEKALFEAWEGLEKYQESLVLVGGLAVHYHTKDTAAPIYMGTNTLDVDLGIQMATEGGMKGTVGWDVTMLGYKTDKETGRLSKKIESGHLYLDFLTEQPPRTSGVIQVSDITASVFPGIQRALDSREFISIEGIDSYKESRTFQIPLCGIAPLLVLKLNAFAHRASDKRAKDAYDILVAVSSYSKGAQAAVTAFHDEEKMNNSGYATALNTLSEYFCNPDDIGPKEAEKFRFGSIVSPEDGPRLRADLANIAKLLMGL